MGPISYLTPALIPQTTSVNSPICECVNHMCLKQTSTLKKLGSKHAASLKYSHGSAQKY